MPSEQETTAGEDLAASIDREPMGRGGTSFLTHTLCQVGAERMEFRATRALKLFATVIVGAGILAIFAGIALLLWAPEEMPKLFALVPFGFGAIMAGFGGYKTRQYLQPVVFDRADGVTWSGKEKPAGDAGKPPQSLQPVRAVQVLSHRTGGGRQESVVSFEINLALEGRSRHHVLDHGNHEHMLSDARKLAEFLGVPVLDQTGD